VGTIDPADQRSVDRNSNESVKGNTETFTEDRSDVSIGGRSEASARHDHGSEISVKGSAHDAKLIIETTPSTRVNWPGDDMSGRSAYDARLIIDTTPSARLEPTPPSSSIDDSSASNDQ